MLSVLSPTTRPQNCQHGKLAPFSRASSHASTYSVTLARSLQRRLDPAVTLHPALARRRPARARFARRPYSPTRNQSAFTFTAQAASCYPVAARAFQFQRVSWLSRALHDRKDEADPCIYATDHSHSSLNPSSLSKTLALPPWSHHQNQRVMEFASRWKEFWTSLLACRARQ